MRSAVSILLVFVILAAPARMQLRESIELPDDFQGDGCTLFPDGNYRDCCVLHDLDYFRGGTAADRKESDKRLYRRVRSKKGWQNEIAAPLMLFGVRLFGRPSLPTPFRWGFGQKRKGS